MDVVVRQIYCICLKFAGIVAYFEDLERMYMKKVHYYLKGYSFVNVYEKVLEGTFLFERLHLCYWKVLFCHLGLHDRIILQDSILHC